MLHPKLVSTAPFALPSFLGVDPLPDHLIADSVAKWKRLSAAFAMRVLTSTAMFACARVYLSAEDSGKLRWLNRITRKFSCGYSDNHPKVCSRRW